MGVRCGTRCAEVSTVPGCCSLSRRGGRAGCDACGESVGAGAIFKWPRRTQVFWYMPGRNSISAPIVLYRFAKVLGRSDSEASKFLHLFVRNCHPWLIVEVERHNHVGQVT